MHDPDTPSGMQATSAYEDLTVRMQRLASLADSPDYAMDPACGKRLVKILQDIAESIEQDTLKKVFNPTEESPFLSKYNLPLDALIQEIKADVRMKRNTKSTYETIPTKFKSDLEAKAYDNTKKASFRQFVKGPIKATRTVIGMKSNSCVSTLHWQQVIHAETEIRDGVLGTEELS
ncbi:hypothetical protein MSAN_00841000 [Mycena sanguinolenta]|uniref:Uncharacterized protein n=1 Tax=Mycena sanguinolenta TaxID=230812 RepID=A0A8H6YYT2_9AGAR|nr:hypothetical protein MSAN_00841000 [Mycena sanguinolenta]